MPGGWVYIMTNSPHGTLYIGGTADIATRVHLHREGRSYMKQLIMCIRVKDSILRIQSSRF